MAFGKQSGKMKVTPVTQTQQTGPPKHYSPQKKLPGHNPGPTGPGPSITKGSKVTKFKS